MTPEELERQRENHRRLEEIIERRLQREGLTRDEALRTLANPRR